MLRSDWNCKYKKQSAEGRMFLSSYVGHATGFDNNIIAEALYVINPLPLWTRGESNPENKMSKPIL